jgi:AcrR family transcriptional regulator
MPKDTFFNLPEDKRALICDVAIDEFAAYPFDQASVNRIVAQSGIAKGSFYQYFEDKQDLFLYIMHLIAEEKINYIAPIVRNPDAHDIFTLTKEMFLSGIQFVMEHPRYAAISSIFMAHKEAPIYKEAKVDNMPASYEIFETLLEKAVAKGEVRTDIDIQMFAYLIASMSVIVVEYYSEFYSHAIDEAMLETVEKFTDFLKYGIGSGK